MINLTPTEAIKLKFPNFFDGGSTSEEALNKLEEFLYGHDVISFLIQRFAICCDNVVQNTISNNDHDVIVGDIIRELDTYSGNYMDAKKWLQTFITDLYKSLD